MIQMTFRVFLGDSYFDIANFIYWENCYAFFWIISVVSGMFSHFWMTLNRLVRRFNWMRKLYYIQTDWVLLNQSQFHAVGIPNILPSSKQILPLIIASKSLIIKIDFECNEINCIHLNLWFIYLFIFLYNCSTHQRSIVSHIELSISIKLQNFHFDSLYFWLKYHCDKLNNFCIRMALSNSLVN